MTLRKLLTMLFVILFGLNLLNKSSIKILDTIKPIYASVLSRVKYCNTLSKQYGCSMGVTRRLFLFVFVRHVFK